MLSFSTRVISKVHRRRICYYGAFEWVWASVTRVLIYVELSIPGQSQDHNSRILCEEKALDGRKKRAVFYSRVNNQILIVSEKVL